MIEAKYTAEDHILTRGKDQLQRYLSYIEPEFGVLIGVGYLALQDSDGILVEIDSPESDDLNEVASNLSPPHQLRTAQEDETAERQSTGNIVSESYYEIDLGELETALTEVDQAESTQEKGDTFASILFDAIDFLEVRDRSMPHGERSGPTRTVWFLVQIPGDMKASPDRSVGVASGAS